MPPKQPPTRFNEPQVIGKALQNFDKGAQGHRQRLRRRFLRDHGTSMDDYELLELLLTYAIPRRDTKPLAKLMLQKFDNLSNLLAATDGELKQFKGLGEGSTALLRLIGVLQKRGAKQRILNQHVIACWEELEEYCRLSYGELRREEFHAVLLDQQNRIREDLILGQGSIAEVVVYPREIVKLALDFHARSLVLIHNHPGGSATPSQNDIRMTVKLSKALGGVDITIFDHLIIARGGAIFSFKSKGLL